MSAVSKTQFEDEFSLDIIPLGQHCIVELMPAKSKHKRSGQNDHESEQKRLRKWQITVIFID